jgi:hypothetical protein
MYAGKGMKAVPQINAPPGNNNSQSTMSITIPAGKESAFVHLHGSAASQEAGVAFVNNFKESDMLKTLPREIRKIVVNFRGGQSFVNDMEVLRGDMLDVVELKSGDQLRGTLKETSFALQTFYGAVQLPVEQVIGLMNVGRFRPRQLVITVDGQIFGGLLDKDSVKLELTSGQITQIPLSQITRLGYRKRDGEARGMGLRQADRPAPQRRARGCCHSDDGDRRSNPLRQALTSAGDDRQHYAAERGTWRS